MRTKLLLYKIIFLLSFTIFFSSGHIENPDTHLRLTQARCWVDNGSIEVEKGFGELSHGNIAINKEGKQFSVYNPGQIIVFIPIYFISKYIVSDPVDTYYTSAFIASFLGYLVFGVIIIIFWELGGKLELPKRQVLITTLIFAFTSYCFAHAQDSYEQIYEALFLLLCILFLLKKDLSEISIILAAVSLGIGLIFRTTIIIAVPGILWLITRTREKVLFLFTLLPFIFLLLYYNFFRFGNPFETGYSLAWYQSFGKTSATSFTLVNIPKHSVALLFSFGKGLLWFSPSLILVCWSIKNFWRHQRKLSVSLYIISICYIGFYAANFAWHGSAWNWGPRYIIPIVPLLYLNLFYLSGLKRKLGAAVCLLSFSVQILAISTFYKRDLIKILISKGDIFWTDNYFFNPSYSPIKGQIVSLYDVTKSISSPGPKSTYLFRGPWKNEGRPASQQTMLNNSIDLNTYNFWWVRELYMTGPILKKIFTLFLALLASLVLIILLKNLWKQANRNETML
ncbi:hypothetical protein [Desertivirga arenae]|uniref:hypothetical protein n=1 Tax=Desertivirga arenae TaxID=2810309 RepID=UPI001A9749E0|nr:hypothetical protein [Pedobacter sp. SYSU D00823]